MNAVMQKFLHDMLSYSARIKRAAYLTDLKGEYSPDSHTVTITGVWDGGQYVQQYSTYDVMGRFAAVPPLQQRIRQRICSFRDDFVRAALAARGV